MLTLTLIVFTVISSVNSDYTPRFGRYYRFFNISMTWFEAIDFCASPASGVANGVPVIQRNTAEASFINTELLKNTSQIYWLGLFTTQSVGGWTTLTNEPLSWTQWHSGQVASSVGEPCGASGIDRGQRGWSDEHCAKQYAVVCESREILCDCLSGIIQWYQYDTKQKRLKNWKTWCCCSKTTEIHYSKLPGNNISFPLVEVTGSRSRLECAAFCARTNRCVSFRHVTSDGQCLLYESTPQQANQSLPRGNGGSYKCH